MILDKIKEKLRKKPNPILTKTIKELDLTSRTYHVLRKAGIATVGDLVQLSWNDLASMRRTTRASCTEVEKVLKGLGLGFREEK